MKDKYLKLGLMVLMIFSFTVLKGQDPQFSQFYNSSLYYNPATAGLTRDLRISTSYRKLWSKIPGDLSTYFISADYRWSKPKVGIGLLLLNDNEGYHNLLTQRLELIFSYRPIDSRDQMLQFGMSVFSVNKKEFRTNNFVFTDQLDPTTGVFRPSSFVYAAVEPVIYADWNAGVVYRKNIFFRRNMTPTIGFSVSHLTRPEISLVNSENVRLPLKFVLHASLLTQVAFSPSRGNAKAATLNPGFVYEYQEPFHTFTLGSSFNADPIRLGMWFRNQGVSSGVYKFNSVIINAGIKITTSKKSYLVIDYSYDSTVSKLEFASGGAHEITLIYIMPLPRINICYTEWWKEGENYNAPELKKKR